MLLLLSAAHGSFHLGNVQRVRLQQSHPDLRSPFHYLIRNWNTRGKRKIWSNQYCLERLAENPRTLTFRNGMITKGCFYPYVCVLLACTDAFTPRMDLLHLTGGTGGGERETVEGGNEDIIIFPAGTIFPAGAPAGPVVIRSNVISG